jgi:hypothetical protein
MKERRSKQEEEREKEKGKKTQGNIQNKLP